MKNLQEKAIAASEKFLERRGYEIINTNWEAPDGFGSIDIVAEDEDAIVFVDVKAARGTDGFPTRTRAVTSARLSPRSGSVFSQVVLSRMCIRN